MDNIETGLYLPIRFYQTSTEQDRYKRHSLGVSLTELNYPYVDCASLAPFQIRHATDSETNYAPNAVILTAICADTNTVIPLPYNAAFWENYNANDVNWLSYLGGDDFTGLLQNGLYYLEVYFAFPSGDNWTYYSDLFRISNCGIAYDTEEYRVYSETIEDTKRLIDVTDLRIIK